MTCVPRRELPAALLYHRVAPDRGAGDRLCVSPRQFELQMRYLVENGYSTAPGLAGAAWKPVVITFDDGYLDVYTVAFPILQRLRLTATVFLVSGSMGAMSGAWGPRRPVPLMAWAHAAEMARAGFSLQSHTRSHCDLARVPEAQALDELAGSRAEIEDRLGAVVDSIAYPFGSYDRRVIGLARRAGYRSGWAAGLAPPGPFSRERFQIKGDDWIGAFAIQTSGWGGWLRRAHAALRPGRIARAHTSDAVEQGG
jgi:peptidoglycan/xylan/chitin deacetylase (PgdA/CDA1 family)